MRSLFLSLVVFSFACGDDSAGFDGGPDAGSRGDVGMSDAGGDDAGADAGDDSGPVVDTGPMSDAGPVFDAPPLDAGRDAGTDAGRDAGTDAGRDAGTDAGRDAGTDAGPPCHDYTFGQPAVEFQGVDVLPVMTGGAIPRGIYDAVEMRTTGMLRGTYRGTWVFEDDTTLQTIEQLALSGAPPEATPRTQNYRSVGTSLQRNRTCGGSDTFDNQYQVRREGGRVLLDVRQAGLLFTFQLRN